MTTWEKNQTTPVGCFVILLGTLLLPALYGWLLQKCWAWFMVPTFHVPALTLVQAIGLDLTVSIVVLHINWTEIRRASTDEDHIMQFMYRVLYALYFLAFAWALHRFFM